MKTFHYICNLLSNIFSLIKVASVSSEIFWSRLTNNQERCIINRYARVANNHYLNTVSIGYGTAIGMNASISQTTIGKFCSIGPNLLCGWGIHPTNGISTSPAFYSTKKQNGFSFSKKDKIEERKPILIGNDVFVGANVTILDGVQIGDGAIIGAGAIVSKDIPPYAIAVGCPIRIVKYRFEKEIIDELLELKWWDQNETILHYVEENFFDVEKFLELVKGKKLK